MTVVLSLGMAILAIACIGLMLNQGKQGRRITTIDQRRRQLEEMVRASSCIWLKKENYEELEIEQEKNSGNNTIWANIGTASADIGNVVQIMADRFNLRIRECPATREIIVHEAEKDANKG